MKIISFITDSFTISRILSHLEIDTEPPYLEPARDPPQMEWDFESLVYREDIDLLLEVDGPVDPFPEMIDPPHPEEIFIEPLDNQDQTVNW